MQGNRVDTAAGTLSASERSRAEQELTRCVSALARGQRFLVTMHHGPDGDAVGSALGLAQALRELGRQVTVYNPSGIPAQMRFLPGAAQVVKSVPPDARFDVTVACDTADPKRLGPELPEAERRGTFVNLDHHGSTPHYGDVNVIDPRASAVGVLVHRILGKLEHRLSAEVATCLWVSLSSDTGNFRHPNTDVETLRIAAQLVEAGAQPGEVTSQLYDSQPFERLKLLADALPSIALAMGGKVAHLTVTAEMVRRAGTDQESIDGFIAYPRSIAGVEVALVFREEAGRVRVSLRSRGRIDVSAAAARLGGGGHHNASGCTLETSLETARAMVLSEVERELGKVFSGGLPS